MGQFPLEYVADDFHVAVTMGAKTGAGFDAIFIDHTQWTEIHIAGIDVIGERKAVTRVEPAMVGTAAGFASM